MLTRGSACVNRGVAAGSRDLDRPFVARNRHAELARVLVRQAQVVEDAGLLLRVSRVAGRRQGTRQRGHGSRKVSSLHVHHAEHLQAFGQDKVVLEALRDCNGMVGWFDPVEWKAAQIPVARNPKQTHRPSFGRWFLG